jgi:predicted aspartyl protease
MKMSRLSKFVVGAALLLCGGSLLIRAAVPLKFTLLHGYLIVIPVTVNGAKPVPFLLDTGASTTLLTPEFARQLGLRAQGRMELITVTGTQILVQAQAESLAVGEHTARQVEVLISDLREVRGVAPQVCGVLGQNFLAQFNYLLDYRARQLVFEEAAELEAVLCGERLPLEMREGQLLMTAPDRQRAWRFVPDSGIAGLVLFIREGQRAALELAAGAPGQVQTDAGRRAVQPRRLRRLQLGETRFDEVLVVLLSAEPADAARFEDGLFPTSLCQRIYFNRRQGYLILNPRL